eukprot:scaffold19667_cov70-Phaeocystis_antarctica.AAC.5
MRPANPRAVEAGRDRTTSTSHLTQSPRFACRGIHCTYLTLLFFNLGRKFEERHSPLALCARLHLHPRLLILTHGGHWSHRLVEESRQDDHHEDHGRLDEQPRLAHRDSPATQHAVVLDAFEAEPEHEGERQRRKVGDEDQKPAKVLAHHNCHSRQRPFGRAAKRRGAIVPPLLHNRHPDTALCLRSRAHPLTETA